jgi:hypothetical protein
MWRTLSACRGELQFTVIAPADCRLKTGSSTMNRAPRFTFRVRLILRGAVFYPTAIVDSHQMRPAVPIRQNV